MSRWDKSARLRRSRSTTTRAPVAARLRDEGGIALIMAIGVMMVLIIVVASVIGFTSAGTRNASRSNSSQKAYSLAEAGINNAVSVLNAAYTVAGSNPGVDFYTPSAGEYLDPAPLLSTPVAMRTRTYDGGTVTWSGTYCFGTNSAAEQAAGCNQLLDWGIWRIEAVATVRNPTGPGAAPVVRRIKAAIQAFLPSTTTPASGLWNWIFSGKSPTPRTNTSGTCDVTIPNSVQVSSPLYVTGNLCVENGASIVQPTGGSPVARVGQKNRLVVGGFLRNNTNSSAEGVDSALGRLTEASIMDLGRPVGNPVEGCSYKKNDSGSNWVFAACGPLQNVFVDGGQLYTTPPDGTVAAPPIVPLDAGTCPPTGECVDLNQLYTYSHPGPLHPCFAASTNTGTTQVPPAFDNNTVRTPGGSLTTVQNLTPAKSYWCRTVAGELSWDVNTKVLTVKGPLYFDGSIVIAPPSIASYTGRGAIFASGTFVLKNSTLCALLDGSGTDCDYSGWDPNLGSNFSALTIAAMGNCSNGGLETQEVTCNGGGGIGIQIKSANFQGLLFARNDIDIVTTARAQGPMVTPRAVRLGQSSIGTFPPLPILPTGTPGAKQPPATLAPPQDFGG